MTTTTIDLIFDIYYKGKKIGTAKTKDRMDVLREQLTAAELQNTQPGDIEFRVISATMPSPVKGRKCYDS